MIRRLIQKIKKRRFCKLNGYFCPDCIYHDFIWEGAIFRGNRCRYPEEVKADHALCDAPTIDLIRCGECRLAKANGTYQWCGRLDSTARITADDFCSYGQRKESE